MTALVDGDRNTMEDHSLAVPSFGSGHNVGGQVVQAGGGRGESVGLAIEFLGDRANEPKINAVFAEVTGHLFHTEEIGLGSHGTVDGGPECVVVACWWRLALQNGREAIDDSLVVDEDVSRPLGSSRQVHYGECLGNLGVLREPVDP